jgi:hypothetical protein
MTRANFIYPSKPQSAGFDMVAMSRQVDSAPSVAAGCYVTAVADVTVLPGSIAGYGVPSGPPTVACSTGGSLGTGMNTDRYAPAIEQP